MRVSSRVKDDIVILSLDGKFVAGTDGLVLRERVKDLIAAGTRKLLFNFTDVPYIDSTGLGFLAGSRELAVEAGAIIVLAGLNPHVRRILDGVKLSQFFDVADDESAGLARIEQLGRPAPSPSIARQAGESSANRAEGTSAARAKQIAPEE